MPKQKLKSEVNNFVGGLNSDSSPLNYQPAFTKFEKNYESNIDGTRDRRYGLAIDSSYEYVRSLEYLYSYGGVSQFTWTTPENYKFFVFYNSNLLEITSSTYPYTLLTSISLTGADASSLAVVDGRLIVAGGKVFVVEYKQSTGFTTSEIRLKTRDLWGVEDGLEGDVTTRPTTLSPESRYNLQNQSWGIPRKNQLGTLVDPIEEYNTSLLKYPSNSEAVWAGLGFQPVSGGTNPFERLYPTLFDDVFGAEISSAKGYFIIDLLQRGVGRETARIANNSKHSTLYGYSITFPQDETQGGPTVVGSYAGRAWYAGFGGDVIDGDKRSPYLADMVFFSQLVKEKTHLEKCYSEGDPTSRDSNDLVDTDGGFIKISGMVKPFKMIELQKGLIIFAENGIWAIRGEDQSGFKATAYRVEKVSEVGAISKYAIVQAEDRVFYLSRSGVNVVELDNNGEFIQSDISSGRIRNYYAGIKDRTVGVLARDPLKVAKGFFDPLNMKVRWTIPIVKNANNARETIEIVFDIRLKSYTINIYNNVFISCGFYSENDKAFTPDGIARNLNSVSLLYHIVWQIGSQGYWGIARPRNTKFRDFGIDGLTTDAEAVLVTGDQVFSDSSVKKQAPFITVHMRRTETRFDEYGNLQGQSSCKMRTYWDWAVSELSNKISQEQEVYRIRKFNFPEDTEISYSPEFSLATSRNKVRGIGKSLAIEFRSVPEKDCRLVGWSISITGNQNE